MRLSSYHATRALTPPPRSVVPSRLLTRARFLGKRRCQCYVALLGRQTLTVDDSAHPVLVLVVSYDL